MTDNKWNRALFTICKQRSVFLRRGLLKTGQRIYDAFLVYFGFTKGFHMLLPKGEIWSMLGVKLPF